MKVLQIITSLSTGGAEKLVVDSVPLYQQKGVETDVLCLKNTQTPFWKELKKRTFGKIEGLTSGSVYNPFLISKIIPFLRKYDVVHIHLFPTLYWVVLAKWFSFSKVKLIYTEHNTDNRRRQSFFFKWLDRMIYKGVDKIVTIADEVDENLKKHLNYKNKDKFRIINNGVPVSVFLQAEKLPKEQFFSKEDILLIQVSSFREQKDQPTLIKSLKYLPENIKLLLVGEGNLRTDCEELVNSLNLQHRVKFLGVRTDIPNLLQTSDIVVLSSRHEGLSLSSIEGMAAKPFIASDVPGLREIVKGYGLLFEKGNSEELANHILSLCNDKAFYSQIADRCLERAKQFDISKMVEEYIEVYNIVIK